ncbi:MAG: FkbM family methyltransferase [Methanogenium sp.]
MSLFEVAKEKKLIDTCIRSGDIVFDIGAYQGDWTELVVDKNAGQIHLFEPNPICFSVLKNKFISYPEIFISQVLVSDLIGIRPFYIYPQNLTLNTTYRRFDAETKYNIGLPNTPIDVPAITVERYCEIRKIPKINYLKIDAEGSEFDIIKGAYSLLNNKAIDFIEFEYGGTYIDSHTTLAEIHSILRSKDYHILKVEKTHFILKNNLQASDENFEYSIFVAALSLDVFEGKIK